MNNNLEENDNFIESEIKRYIKEIETKFKSNSDKFKDYNLYLLSSINSIWFDFFNDDDELDLDLDEKNRFLIKEDVQNDNEEDTTIISFIYEENNYSNSNIVSFIVDKIWKIKELKDNEEIDTNNNIKYTCFFDKVINQSKKDDLFFELKKQIKNIEKILEIVDIAEVAQKWSNLNLYNVNKFTFKMNSNEFLKYKNDQIDAIVLNISAKSISKVYQKYGKNNGPLYSENLRYHIKDKKVDEPIKLSIKEDYKNFWFKNNGLVIIAKSYEINKENEITINEFSVVNGGQTTFMIGETEFENDFYVLTKILIPNIYLSEDERKKFIESIAISTNKQKQIKDKDLIANDPVVNTLNKAFLNKRYLFDYKRGQKIPDFYKTKFEKHRIIKIDEIGQLYLAIFNQSPGSAKNEKSKIWKNELKNKIFDESKVDIYINAHELWFKLDKIRKEKIKQITSLRDNNDKSLIKYLKTGGWFIYLTILLFYWTKKLQNKISDIINENDLDHKQYVDTIQKNLENDLFFEIRLEDKELEENIEKLMIITTDFVVEVFENMVDNNKNLQFSNWTKTNKNILKVAKKVSRKYSSNNFNNENVDKYLDAIFK